MASAQRRQNPVTSSATGPVAVRDARWRRLSTFIPKNPSSAGSRVSEDSMVSATVMAADTATP
jgi:hypothetical protein